MWIVKPVLSLSESEKAAWAGIAVNLPLAQNLNWARAIEAVSGKTFLAYSPDEEVGGMVFCAAHSSGNALQFECINGPWLHWDNPQAAPRQLATFAIAVSRI